MGCVLHNLLARRTIDSCDRDQDGALENRARDSQWQVRADESTTQWVYRSDGAGHGQPSLYCGVHLWFAPKITTIHSTSVKVNGHESGSEVGPPGVLRVVSVSRNRVGPWYGTDQAVVTGSHCTLQNSLCPCSCPIHYPPASSSGFSRSFWEIPRNPGEGGTGKAFLFDFF
jgi:hypothetical protein